jgi:enterochelin esterase family protein
LSEVHALPAPRRARAAAARFERLRGELEFPLTQEGRATFVYRGEAHEVGLVGDTSHWMQPTPFERIEHTDLFVLRQRYETDARLDYKLVVDGKWMLDPLNRRRSASGFGRNSELCMPDYVPHPEALYNARLKHGRILHEELYSRVLRQRRRYHIYLPPGHDEGTPYPVLYFQDGHEYMSLAKAHHILDALIAAGTLPPSIGIFVDPIERMREYATNDRYVAFLVGELMEKLDKEYAVSAGSQNRTLVGDSMGGLISLYLAYRFPRRFGRVLSHSGAFSWGYSELAPASWRGMRLHRFCDEVRAADLPLRVFLAIGTYERHVGTSDLVVANERMAADLASNPTVLGVTLRKYHQGHSWGLWRDTLAEGLEWLQGEGASGR